jgi:hypothetical protein
LHCTTDFLGATSSGNERMWNRHPELGGTHSIYFFRRQIEQNSIARRYGTSPEREPSQEWVVLIRHPVISGSDAPVQMLPKTGWNTVQGYRRGPGYRRETRQEAGPAIYKARQFRCCRFTETVRVTERERDQALAPSLALCRSLCKIVCRRACRARHRHRHRHRFGIVGGAPEEVLG